MFSYALRSGNVPATWLWCIYSAVQFPVYDAARGVASAWVSQPWLSGLLCGGIASGVATLASHPFDVMRTILAGQGEPRVGSHRRV